MKVAPLLEMAGKWHQLLTSAVSEEQLQQFRAHQRTPRVLGDEASEKQLQKKLARVLRRQKPGPKRSPTK